MRKYLLLILSFVFHFSALSADNYTFCYWVDDNHTAAQTITQATNKFSTTMDVASLPEGLHTLFVRARKNTGSWTSPKASHFYKVLDPTTVKTYYWFNDNEDNRFEVTKTNGETFTIDVSHLSDGTHTLHVRMEGEGTASSATVSNQFLKISTNFSAYYWFDNETERHEYANAGGSSMLIDVSHLKEGLHCFNAMLLNDSGTPTSVVSRTFLKIAQPTANDSTMLTFWIDGKQHSEQKVAYGNEIVDFELDVADLSTGMHYLKVQAMTNSGATSNIASAYFMRMPYQNSDGVIAYRYWVNDNNANLPFTAVENPTIPYELIGDLDVVPQPLRCANFHFEVNNDMPMLYAVNDLHVQFMAADGHLIKSVNQYVESIAADTLTDEKWTEIKNDTVIKANTPTGETIYWYAMNLEEGDTICLKTNYSSTLQLFSHSGNQVFESKADSSLIFRQFIAEKAEMYYVALHTVNTTKAQVTLTVDLKKLIHYYQVETSVIGNGTVTEGGTYAEGTEITLTATPDEGYQFTQWSDGNTDNPRTLVLTQDTSLVAHFEIIYLQPDTVTLCYGETYQWHDKTYDASGVYIDTISSGVATLYLTILPQVEETIEEATICAGDTYTWQADGKVYAESGTYSVTLQDINGCDSVVILHLTVNPIATTEETIVACDSYEWNGQSYTQSGDYTYTTTATNGCDSIVTLHLTINDSEIGEAEFATICYGETFTWNGQTYSTEGEYSVTLTNALGCDSTATLHLTIMPEAITTTETVVVGSDELPYTWRGNTYSATGQYTVVEQYTTVACDSAIYVLDLMVLSTGNYDEQSVTICETEAPYTWYGESYSATGKYTYTEKYAGTDIDSIQHILNLTVNPTVYTEEHVTACDSYTWNGETYTVSGDYTYTTTAATSCDSIVTLHLTINKSEHVEFSMTACDSYEWHGITYTQSGDYTYNTTTDAGCERVEVLHLTINKSEHVEFSMTACDAYEWHGLTYTQSGDYTYTTTTAAGCERVEVLHLTINKSEHVEFTETACDEYVWNGVTYTESGDYTYNTTTAAGCERVEVLHLTINKSEREEYTAVACDSYEWHGVTYTASGDYTFNTTTAAGCERVEVLHLTINKSEREEYTVVACDEYVWNGVTHTESGDYTYNTTTAAGCERVEVLHLTINKSEYVEFTEVTCDSYEWNGVVYTESGDYTYNTTTANGCERVEVLHLIILPAATTESETLALCPSELPYEWYGQTLTEAGSYTATEQYAGMECDSIIHELTLNVYVQTLPAAVTLPIVRTGEAIDVTTPTAEIQAHIAAETWYAPNAEVAWYIMENSDWAALSAEPVATGITEVTLKYVVDTDCGNVESDKMVINLKTTDMENTQSQSPTSNCQKILYEDHIYILREGKIYNAMGQEL